MIEPSKPQLQRVSYALPMHRQVVTWVLLGIIGIVFATQTAAGGSTEPEVLVRLGAKVSLLIAAGEYWRLFTAMFLHIGITHLLFNGYALFVLGAELERIIGWQRFLTIYILSGLMGNLASYAFSPHLAAGASGAIFGLIGALAAFFMLHREALGKWGQRRLLNIVFLIAVNLFFGFTRSGIDNYAHMGGLVAGLGLGWALAPRYKLDPITNQVIDDNRLARYWPALTVAILVFIGGTILTTAMRRDSVESRLYSVQQAADIEDWEKVIAESEAVLAQDPLTADGAFHFYLGLARYYLGQPQEAASAYEAGLEISPSDPSLRWNLAQIYFELGEYSKAQTQFETLLQLHPDQAQKAQPYLDQLRVLNP